MSQAQAYIALALGIATLSGLMAGLVRHLVKYYLSELRDDGNGGQVMLKTRALGKHSGVVGYGRPVYKAPELEKETP